MSATLERLECADCGEAWEREVKPGRKPGRCPDCNERNGNNGGGRPPGGYENGTKACYRERVWRAISSAWGGDMAAVDALLLPGGSSLEIDKVVELGVSPESIHAVEKNPAVLAHADWKADYPPTNGYGGKLSRVSHRIADNGQSVQVANIDLTGCFSRETLNTLTAVGESGVFDEACVVGLTMLKGRESHETSVLLEWLASELGIEGDQPRIKLGFRRLFSGRKWWLVESDEYRSGSQTMVWGVAAAATPELVGREMIGRFGILDSLVAPVADAQRELNQLAALERSRTFDARLRKAEMLGLEDADRSDPEIDKRYDKRVKHLRTKIDEWFERTDLRKFLQMPLPSDCWRHPMWQQQKWKRLFPNLANFFFDDTYTQKTECQNWWCSWRGRAAPFSEWVSLGLD